MQIYPVIALMVQENCSDDALQMWGIILLYISMQRSWYWSWYWFYGYFELCRMTSWVPWKAACAPCFQGTFQIWYVIAFLCVFCSCFLALMCAPCFQGTFQLQYVMAFLCVFCSCFLALTCAPCFQGTFQLRYVMAFLCVFCSCFLALFLFLAEIHAAHFKTWCA